MSTNKDQRQQHLYTTWIPPMKSKIIRLEYIFFVGKEERSDANNWGIFLLTQCNSCN